MDAIGEHQSADGKRPVGVSLLLLSFLLKVRTEVEGALSDIGQRVRNVLPGLGRIIELKDALEGRLRFREVTQVRPTETEFTQKRDVVGLRLNRLLEESLSFGKVTTPECGCEDVKLVTQSP